MSHRTTYNVGRKAIAALLLLLITSCKPVPPRTNALANEYPGGFGVLPEGYKKAALEFSQTTKAIVDEFGIYSLGQEQIAAEARKEWLPLLAALKGSSANEKKVHEAAQRVVKALEYGGQQMFSKGVWTENDLNHLLRITPTPAPELVAVTEGAHELLLDYVELIAPDSVKVARWLHENSK